jgi:hypothetical protein
MENRDNSPILTQFFARPFETARQQKLPGGFDFFNRLRVDQ